METKADIRKRILKARQELSQKEQKEKSLLIQKKILANPYFQEAEWVFLYMDYKAEVQTGMLLDECFRLGKRIALPRVTGTEMDFYQVNKKEDVQPGYFGILEPVTTVKIEVNKGFMTVPGVAFTKDGYRMGYGKGFYDRYLAKFPEIYTCGLAYDCQIVDELPVEEHDKKLQELMIG